MDLASLPRLLDPPDVSSHLGTTKKFSQHVRRHNTHGIRLHESAGMNMQQGDAGSLPPVWLTRLASRSFLSGRKIYLLHRTELRAAGVCAIAPCELSSSLPPPHASHSSSLSNAGVRTCSFIPSLPASLTHRQHERLSVVNSSSSLVLQDGD